MNWSKKEWAQLYQVIYKNYKRLAMQRNATSRIQEETPAQKQIYATTPLDNNNLISSSSAPWTC